jgi:hypothetical protein
MKRSTPKMRTKSDLVAYAADLEVEIAYLERDKAELREQLEEAISVIHALCEEREPPLSGGLALFSQAHPGTVC